MIVSEGRGWDPSRELGEKCAGSFQAWVLQDGDWLNVAGYRTGYLLKCGSAGMGHIWAWLIMKIPGEIKGFLPLEGALRTLWATVSFQVGQRAIG